MKEPPGRSFMNPYLAPGGRFGLSGSRSVLRLAANAFNAGDFHRRSHPVFAHQVTFLSKFRRNAGSSIGPRFCWWIPLLFARNEHSRSQRVEGPRSTRSVVAILVETPSKRHMVVINRIVGLIHFHEPEDGLGNDLDQPLPCEPGPAAFANISGSTLSCLFSLRNFRSSARWLPSSGRLYDGLHRRVCLGDPVADRLFVGHQVLSGQLTGAAPVLDEARLSAGETRVDKLVLFLASYPPFSQRIRCPRNRGNSSRG